MSTTITPDPSPHRSHGVFSRITRRWGLIFTLWVLICNSIVYLIYRFVQPTYEASSTLHVNPRSERLFEVPSTHLDYKSVTRYLQTQVSLISSDRVLGVAIANPEVVKLAAIKESDDPRADLRKRIKVEIVENAYLIRVALELADGKDAATIVNAVVYSYLTYHGEHVRSANSFLRQSLVTQLDKYKMQINEKRAELKALMKKGKVEDDVTFDITFIQRELDILLRREEQVEGNLEQLDFDTSREDYRVAAVDAAVASKTANRNEQISYMAAVPITVFLALIGLALLSPIKDERVSSG